MIQKTVGVLFRTQQRFGRQQTVYSYSFSQSTANTMRTSVNRNGAEEYTTASADMLAKATGEDPSCNFLMETHRQTAECDSSCGEDQHSTTSSHLTAKESNQEVESFKTSSSPRRTRPIRGIARQSTTRIRYLITEHDYHDHAADPVTYDAAESTASLISSKSRRDSVTSSPTNRSASSTTPFPMKLYEMIEQMESEGMSHVISWQPHGRCFQVHEPNAFKRMSQNYFKLSKMASFQRQLNLYGFQRLTAGLDKGSYYHELFLRNRSDLVRQIHRVKVKGTGVRAKANPQDEPNLYMYPPVDALAISGAACEVVSSSSISMKDLTPRSVPSLDSVAKITSLEQMDNANGLMMDDSEPCFAERSDYCETSSRCEIERGLHLARNLPSTFDDEISHSSSFIPSCKTISYQQPGLRRNVSSSLFDVSPTSARIDDLNNDLTVKHMECIPEDRQSSRDATAAVEMLLLANDGNDPVSFDKLVDEMFHHNQDIEFSELVKRATEV
jgi:HSF-type DNA-binding